MNHLTNAKEHGFEPKANHSKAQQYTTARKERRRWTSSIDPQDDSFVESNLMHSINGFVYGNLKGLDMKQNEKVRWCAMGMGIETDLHTPHWHGQTLLFDGMRTDIAELLPMSMKTLDMVPDVKGSWLFHCHVNDHIEAGMSALFTIA